MSEQRPEDWVAACEAAFDALAAAHDLSAVRGIGLSGQMHGAVCLDAAGAVLRPAILWNDTRAHAEAAAMDADPQFRAVSGNIVFPGFTAPKIAWMAEHEPDLREKIAKVLLPKGLSAPLADRRGGGRDVGCRWNVVAGYRRAGLV